MSRDVDAVLKVGHKLLQKQKVESINKEGDNNDCQQYFVDYGSNSGTNHSRHLNGLDETGISQPQLISGPLQNSLVINVFEMVNKLISTFCSWIWSLREKVVLNLCNQFINSIKRLKQHNSQLIYLMLRIWTKQKHIVQISRQQKEHKGG